MVYGRTHTTPPGPPQQSDELDRLFHCLSDATRRGMLARLRQGPATVAELAEPFAMSMPAVSKHLAVLERGGLVEKTPAGRTKVCRLTPEPLQAAGAWLEAYRGFWDGQLEALDAYLAKERDGR